MFRHLREPHVNNEQRYAHLNTEYYDEISDDEENDKEIEEEEIEMVIKENSIPNCGICQMDTSQLSDFKLGIIFFTKYELNFDSRSLPYKYRINFWYILILIEHGFDFFDSVGKSLLTHEFLINY